MIPGTALNRALTTTFMPCARDAMRRGLNALNVRSALTAIRSREDPSLYSMPNAINPTMTMMKSSTFQALRR